MPTLCDHGSYLPAASSTEQKRSLKMPGQSMIYSLLPWVVAGVRAAETRHSATTDVTFTPHKCFYHEAKTSLASTRAFY